MPQLAEFPDDNSVLIRIRCAGCLLVLSERELVRLLGRDPELWVRGVARGKALLRAEAATRRRDLRQPARG